VIWGHRIIGKSQWFCALVDATEYACMRSDLGASHHW
jgi:hypothetical protein